MNLSEIRLHELNIEQLVELEGLIAKELQKRQSESQRLAREQIFSIAKNVGIPLIDLIGPTGAAGSGRGAPGVSRGPVPIRYRHPENTTLTWTGRGRQPTWIKAWLAAGGNLEDITIVHDATSLK